MDMINIIIVEDDQEICEILSFYLAREQKYAVTIANTAEEALLCIAQDTFDVILVDIMLPGMDGIAFCQQVRRSVYCPIIFISCLDDDQTIIRALQMGGDDYLVKPFRCPVLIAHIEATLRRMRPGQPPDGASLLETRGLRLDLRQRAAYMHGRELFLSPTEFALLQYMLQNRGRLLPFDELYENVWERPSYGDVRTLFVHVRNLRRKMEDDPADPAYIKTVRREGYLLE